MKGETDDARVYEPRFPQYEKRPYRPVFHLPGEEWRVEAAWEDAYYQSAKRLLEGVAHGAYLPAYEGVAGLYLFRHYIELALKFIIFHSRWLKDAENNADLQEIEDVKKGHSLRKLWEVAKIECQRVITPDEWTQLDVEYVERCIGELESVDPSGERFRYHGPKFGVEKDSEKRLNMARTIRYDLYIQFEELPAVVEHVHDVLSYLDVYMIETYGQNKEWQDYLDAL